MNDHMRIMMLHGGQWVKDDYGNDRAYRTREEPRLLLIPVGTTYGGVQNIIFQEFGRHPDREDLTLRFRPEMNINMYQWAPPARITDERSWQWFVGDCVLVTTLSNRTPLIVEFQPKDVPGCSSNPSTSNYVEEAIDEDEDGDIDYDELEEEESGDEPIDEDEDGDNVEGSSDDNGGGWGDVEGQSGQDLQTQEVVDIPQPSNPALAMPIPDRNPNTYVPEVEVGQIFMSKKEFTMHMNLLAMHCNFEFKTVKSSPRRVVLKCKNDNCSWYLRAYSQEKSELFKVTRYQSKHTCSAAMNTRGHCQGTYSVLAAMVKDKLAGVGRVYRPNDIRQDLRREWGLSISYSKAWRTREAALDLVRGSPEASFEMLPHYAFVLEQCNRGTVTAIARDEENHFKHLFMALGQSIRGFKTCIRNVIAVDATHLKGKYLGVMLLASGQDGNNNIYPIAMGVGGAEDDETWGWFFIQLRRALGTDFQVDVIVSDRHKSIQKAVREVFPQSFHGACMYHLSMNLRAKFHTDKVHPIFYKACKEYQVTEFLKLFNEIKLMHAPIAHYLEEVGVHRWARCYQNGNRYGMLTTNISESMNARFKDARELPISALAEFMRNLMQSWFYKRRNKAANMGTLTKWAMVEKIEKRQLSSRRYIVEPVDVALINVHDRGSTFIVDLRARKCSCRVWDIDQIPCSHALAAANYRSIPFEQLTTHYHHSITVVNAYAEPIHPLGEPRDWNVAGMAPLPPLLPPVNKRKLGRQRMKRIPSLGEEGSLVISAGKCTRCRQAGHNRRTCRNPIANEDS